MIYSSTEFSARLSWTLRIDTAFIERDDQTNRNYIRNSKYRGVLNEMSPTVLDPQVVFVWRELEGMSFLEELCPWV